MYIDTVVATNCEGCPLLGEGYTPIRPEGPDAYPDTQFIFVMKSPMEEGNFFGKREEAFFDYLVASAGIVPDTCYLTSVLLCPLPKKKNPTIKMLKGCQPRLRAELTARRSATVVVMGAAAQKVVIPGYDVTRFHGKNVVVDGQKYIIMNDPSPALAMPNLKWVAEYDFRHMLDWEPVTEIDGDYTTSEPQHVLRTNGVMVLDVETVDDKLFGAALSAQPGAAQYFEGDGVAEALRQSEATRLLGHNLKYDLQLLQQAGFDWHGMELDDTMLLAYCMNYEKIGLKVLETQELNLMHPSYKQICPKGTLADQPVEKVARYCCQDTDSTHRLWPYLWRSADERERNLYNVVEKPLLPVLTDMEVKGVLIDREYSEDWREILLSQAAGLLDDISSKYGIDAKVLGSPRQLGDWLTSQGVSLPTTESGQYATGKELLAGRMGEHEAIPDILRYRQVLKLKSTYADAMLGLVDEYGRLHPRWNQARVVTGRLSCSEPNLQNLPYSYAARRPIIVPKGMKILTLDYSQVDMRALAVLTQDEGLLEAFQKGWDIHNWMADKLFGNHEGMNRHIIKSASYLAIYGGQAEGLHTYLNAPMGEFDLEKMGNPPSLQECKDIIDGYYDQFKGIGVWQAKTKRFVQQKGYVEDYWGRRRYIPKATSKNYRLRQAGLREAINLPVAGTASEIFKLSIIAVAPILTPIMNIHDELAFEVPEGQIDEIRPKLQAAMEGIAFPVPLVVNWSVGDSLGELLQ